MHRFFLGIIASAGFLLADPVFGASQKDHDDCSKSGAEAAIVACTRVVDDRSETSSKRVAAFISRGNAWYEKEDYDRALADYSEAIRLDPKDVVAYANRGLSLRMKGNYGRARADFSEAIRLDPNYVDAYINRAHGWAVLGPGGFDRALADFSEAIRLAPQNAYIFNERGLIHWLQRNFDSAIADYSEAIRLDPKFISAYHNRGKAWEVKADYSRALADFSEAIRLASDDEWTVKGYRERGFINLRLGRLDASIADYDAALKIDPINGFARYGRGIAKQRKGDRAIGDAEIAAVGASIASSFASYYGHGTPAPVPATVVADCSQAETHWKSAETIGIVAVYEDHLAKFPTCAFAVLAKAKIGTVKK